jgi:hypothetical protein
MSLQDSNFTTSHVLQIIGWIFLVLVQNEWIVYAKKLDYIHVDQDDWNGSWCCKINIFN